jgi:hypothetical protein
MSEKIPPGWGFPADAPPSKREPVARDGEPTTADKIRVTSRRRNRLDQRKTYMRFALWAQKLGREPMPGEICDTFDVHWETARRLIADWKAITKEQP